MLIKYKVMFLKLLLGNAHQEYEHNKQVGTEFNTPPTKGQEGKLKLI
jgi:hypothetical protein